MPQRNVKNMPPAELWEEWRSDFAEIKRQIHFLFRGRRTFRQVTEVFRKNERLQSVGGHLWDWMRISWASHVIIQIRRETDDQNNTVNLNQLFREIETRPDVVTRDRYFTMLNLSEDQHWLRPMLEETFTREWLPEGSQASTNPEDRVDVRRVRADREMLQNAVARVVEFANRRIAHRSRVDPRSLTFPEIDAAFDVIEQLLKKYHLLLDGSALDGAEPTPQFDTYEVFTFPWLASEKLED